MSELKKCPFCGSEAITTTFIDPDDFEYMPIEVNDCDAEVTCENERCINGWYLSPKAWNTRPIEDALNARIAELEYQLEDWTNNGWAEDYKARIAELEAENETIISDYEERMDNLVNIGNETGRLLQAEIGYLNAQLGIKNLTTETLKLRIAELDGFIDRLIEAGERMSLAVECENQIEANAYYSWKELVKDWKERER